MESGGESLEDREIDQWKTVVSVRLKKKIETKHCRKKYTIMCDVRKK